MNAEELFLKDGKSAGVFYCGKCRVVHREIEQAVQCCEPYRCKDCGALTGRHSLVCWDCIAKRDAAKEAENFKAAEKITSWGGWVYREGYGRDGFAHNVEDLFDCCGDDEKGPPDYVWTCDPVQFAVVSVDDLLEQVEQNENAYGDFDRETLDGIPELKKAVDAFNEANTGVVSYQPNFKRALLMSAYLTPKP